MGGECSGRCWVRLTDAVPTSSKQSRCTPVSLMILKRLQSGSVPDDLLRFLSTQRRQRIFAQMKKERRAAQQCCVFINNKSNIAAHQRRRCRATLLSDAPKRCFPMFEVFLLYPFHEVHTKYRTIV